MRCENIKVKFSIPIPINKPDSNGNIYTEEAVINAYKNINNFPIIKFNDKGEEVVVGVANKVDYSNGIVNVEGIIYYGGTEEIVKINDENKITSFEISSFGISE